MSKCVLCQNENFKDAQTGQNPDLLDVFVIERCRNCGLMRTKDFQEINLAKYYETTDYYAKKFSAFNILKDAFAAVVKKAPITRLKANGKLLDVGCGDGKFLNLFSNREWDLYGIEPYGKPVSPSKNIKFISEKFENTKLQDSSFDVITMWHVLEHIENPTEVLRELHRILKPDGLIFISVPNINSFSFRLFKQHWFALYLPIHTYHYSINTLTALLNISGFEVQTINKFPIEYSPFVILQSLLNSTELFPPNFLYKYLRGIQKGFPQFVSNIIVAVLFLPIYLGILIFEAVDPKGSSVISIFAKKKAN
ncbi:class I SAM-dependent methyltransferase [Patescibacteria group bacterium]|nr:class I SAM-dependent methyltransferase [Patescibacteria group bacterium]